ncbi:MAG: tRNA (cytidine(34)-2'-O)-methyltransferase [Ureaplasma sp.]|nr:tRNA (cytidine(34)-2'-O)-methyltransferase [Ureaplasma sp.]
MQKNSLNIVLFEPEIPENTGNIIRTCESFDFKLHLIRPYGFFLNSKNILRSCTNHFNENNIFQYDDFNDFCNKNNVNNNIFLFTKKGTRSPDQIKYESIYKNQNIYLMFGKESSGIANDILNKFDKQQWIRIPMKQNIVSINLANTVAIASYEVIKQLDYLNLLKDYKE